MIVSSKFVRVKHPGDLGIWVKKAYLDTFRQVLEAAASISVAKLGSLHPNLNLKVCDHTERVTWKCQNSLVNLFSKNIWAVASEVFFLQMTNFMQSAM